MHFRKMRKTQSFFDTLYTSEFGEMTNNMFDNLTMEHLTNQTLLS